MNIIKTGLELSRTLRNANRVREIISVLAKNGFDEFLVQTNLRQRIPGLVIPKSRFSGGTVRTDSTLANAIGFRLRKSFEELGPGFIKLGQMLATQEHLFDKDLVKELQKLQDNVKPLPFEQAMEILQAGLQCHYSEIFEYIEPKPLGTASIGIVYKGKLKDGSEVVIKIRRPGIMENFESDFEILHFIVRQMEKVNPDIKYLGIAGAVGQLAASLMSELDFNLEALNIARLGKIFAKYDPDQCIRVPLVYPKLSSESVCIMEYLEGPSLKNLKQQKLQSDELETTIYKAIEIFFKAMFIDGHFHGDLHGGNLIIMSPNQIGLIDFGLCGSLSKQSRSGLVAIFYAIINGNYENLTYELLEKAEYEELPPINQLTLDLKNSLSPYVGLSTQQINSTQLLKRFLKTLGSHKMSLPQEWLLILKTIIVLDGMGKSLNIDFDAVELIKNNLKELTSTFLSKDEMLDEGMWVARDLLATFKVVPRYFKWFLRDLSRKNFALEIIHSGHEKALFNLSSAITFVGFSMLAAVTFAGGMYAYFAQQNNSQQTPAISLICWSLAATFAALGMIRIPPNK